MPRKPVSPSEQLRVAKCNEEFRKANPKRGRKPSPPRVVVQLRYKTGGKTIQCASWTFLCEFVEAMRLVQDAFAHVRKSDGASAEQLDFIKRIVKPLMPSSHGKDSAHGLDL